MDEGGADARVAVAAQERVGVAVGGVTLAVLINLVIAAAVGVEGGGVMEDVGHAAEGKEMLSQSHCFFAPSLHPPCRGNHSHYVDDDGAAGGDQHHMALDLIVIADDPLDG